MCPPVVSEHTKSRAEVDVFGIISRELSDEWTALHSLGIAVHNRKPWAEADFVLVGPPGVFVLEVKGGRIRRENGRWISTTGEGRDSESKAEGPFDQAGGASAALFAYLSKQIPSLRSSVVGYGVVTPDISFLVKGPDILREVVYDAADVAAPFGNYVDRLAGYWRDRLTAQKGATTKRLDERTRASVVDLLRGDFDGRLSLRSRADIVNKEILRLTTEQYRVLDGLAANERAIVSGGAGTGKTLLAVEEAARYSRNGRRVLLLCFNRSLADLLSRATSDLPGVTTTTIHSYMRDVVERAGLAHEIPDADDSYLFEVFYPDLAFRAVVEGHATDRFDAVIVDEAQDLMETRYLDVMDAVLDGGLSTGHWRMFYDPRQDLFSSLHPAALTRVRHAAASYNLTINCRNTRPIGVETAMICGFLPSETLLVEGDDVTIRWWSDPGEQVRLLGRDLNRLLSGGFKSADVAILSRRRLGNSSLSAGIAGVPFRLAEGIGSTPPAGALWFATVQAFKGLEADAIFMVDIDDLTSPEAVGALYVGASRARAELFLYVAESTRPQYEERARELGRRLARSD